MKSPFIRTLPALLAASLVFAACGSSSDDTSATGGSQKSASAFPALVSPVEQLQKRPTSIGLEEPLGVPVPRSKTIAYIQCGAPACATNGGFLREALETLGWKMRAINAGTTPEQIKAAYAQALAERPDAVVGTGFARALFEPELRALVAAGIPVVQAYVTDDPSEGVDVLAGKPMIDIAARQVADYVLANSPERGGKLAVVYTSAFPSLKLSAESFEQRVAEHCPDCEVETLDVPGSSIGTDLPTRVSSFLSSHPDVKWAYVGYADMVIGLPAALRGAGIEDVKLVTNNVNTTISGYLESGQMVRAGVGVQTPEVYWRIADLLVRKLAGRGVAADVDDSTLPYWIVTGDNVPSTTESFPGVVDYRAQYEALWGVG